MTTCFVCGSAGHLAPKCPVGKLNDDRALRSGRFFDTREAVYHQIHEERERRLQKMEAKCS